MAGETKRNPRLRELLQRPDLFVWACYIVFIPFYVVAGGYPQPGDALIFLLVPLALRGWNGRMDRRWKGAIRLLIAFSLWVCVVDIAWALILWHAGLNLLFPLYYIYDALLFLVAIVLYQRHGDMFVRVTVQLTYVMVFFQVAASFVMGGVWGSRATVFFQNPNQLGYYALLAACIIVLSQRRLGISSFKASAAMIGCAYLMIISASRSSLAGIALLAILLLFANPRVLVLGTIVAGVLTFVGATREDSFDLLQERIVAGHQSNLTFWEQRGYDRIWNNKEYLTVGAGEGNYWRFAETTAILGAEIHSSVGTLLFSYGVIGTALFFAFCYRVLRGARLRTALILLPPASYSIAHQGLRFSMLWILLALFIVLKETGPVQRAVTPRVQLA